MRLDKWIEADLKANGRGALMRLKKKTGVAYQTIHEIYAGKRAASYATAKAIEDATDGEVTIAELCAPPQLKAATKPKRARTTRRRTATRTRARTRTSRSKKAAA